MQPAATPECDDNQNGLLVRVRGLVQGVGFRPNVWRIANQHGITGNVINDGAGVLIRAFGNTSSLHAFLNSLQTDTPPLSRIDAIETQPLAPGTYAGNGFHISKSVPGAVNTGIVPDAATCPACLSDVAEPSNRRYRYPFTNCTHCGPRLTIVRAIPYDRANTSMAGFTMCAACQAEYDNPTDRRFHAQPNACPKCGPRVWLETGDGAPFEVAGALDPVDAAARLILAGNILAIKGIGGFHLACDATNETAVAQLRRRKHRPDKPLALMARDLAMVNRYAFTGDEERRLLHAPEAPIVLLERRKDTGNEPVPIAASVAPRQGTLGFMLPHAPLHHILTRDLQRPIVLSSGNRRSEPQATRNDEARECLADIADAFLMHDREIVNRADDSLVRIVAGTARTLRRARGFAPAPLRLPPGFDNTPSVLAMGGELKNTFCLTKGNQAILSQHMGDMENTRTHKDYRNALSLYRSLFKFDADVIAVDMHQDYLSTQWGHTLAQRDALILTRVQHHHAHIAANMAQNAVPLDGSKVLGIVLDGLGLGDDGALWGGEFLLADYRDFERVAHFEPVPLPGGAKAMREPWRNTYAHLTNAFDWAHVTRHHSGLDLVKYLQTKPLSQLEAMIGRGLNAPLASSAGRLFDAVAAAIGISPDAISYEGQAAIELETLAAARPDEPGCYGWTLTTGSPRILGFQPIWADILSDLEVGVSPARIAARFHNTLIKAICELAISLARDRCIETIALSGGVFQNHLLLDGIKATLTKAGIANVLTHTGIPANDGGLSLGQALIAAAQHSARP